jgi:nucleotide-binding universal stress UspA family protein
MYRRIVVPLDGSELAESALAHARVIAGCTGAEILLLRVVFEGGLDYYADPLAASSVQDRMEREAAAYLVQVAAGLEKEGLKVTTQVGAGSAADGIIDYADRMQAELIAMTTHGRSGIARWLIGSVADKVARGANVPVLLIRPGKVG